MAVDDSYTKSLLHMDGEDEATVFADESGKSWTSSGLAKTDTAQKVFGPASMRCNQHAYIYTADHADWAMGSGDWTIDCRIRLGTGLTWYAGWQNDGLGNEFYIYWSIGTAYLYCHSKIAGAYNWFFYAPFAMSSNIWYHMAVVRNGGTPYVFRNGISQTITEHTAISGKTAPDIAANFNIGYPLANYSWTDEWRYSKGIARWTANFTPPTAPYAPPSAGQQEVVWIT